MAEKYTALPWVFKDGKLYGQNEVLIATIEFYQEKEVNEANLDLIIHAPELFEALDKMIRLGARKKNTIETPFAV
jgi:hypothetical protein